MRTMPTIERIGKLHLRTAPLPPLGATANGVALAAAVRHGIRAPFSFPPMSPITSRLPAPMMPVLGILLAWSTALPAQITVRPVAVPPAVDSARAALARGAFEEAIRWYDRALAADSLDRTALRESAQVFSGRGEWQRAIPRLGRLIAMGENDAGVLYNYGQYLAWDGRRESGVTFLRRAVAVAPDSTSWRFALGQALTWIPAERAEGIRLLQEIERARPKDMPTRQAIASALAWDPSTRGDALRRYGEMLRDEPKSISIRLDYADVLSWVIDTRGEALRIYQDVQRDDPHSVRAAMGRLNILTWTNQNTAALALADSLLSVKEVASTLRRERGTLLLRLQRVDEAVAVLRPLVDAAPQDYALLEQYGYALLAKGDFGDARRVARRIPEGSAPGAPDWIRRGAAVGLGVDGVLTNTSFGLETFRLSANASAPISRTQRLVATGGPVRYDSPTGSFDGSFATLGMTGRVGALRDTRAEVGVEQFSGAPSAWSLRADGTVPLIGGGTLSMTVRRTAIEDSRRAARGDSVDGTFIGQVRANALDVTLQLPEVGQGFGVQLLSTLAAYTGRNLRTNYRREGTLVLTRPLPLGAQRLEAGIGVMGMSYVFDANRFDSPREEQGGYWSPTALANAILKLGISLPLTGRLVVRMDATGGRLLAGGAPGTNALNVAGGGTVRWTGYRGWDLASGFLYIDNLGGFQLRQWSASIRRAW